jgi:membrane-associated phospholipid phosphatase
VLCAVVLADIAAVAVKGLVDRERPPAGLGDVDVLVATPTNSSFPSGHAAMSAAAAVVLVVLVPRVWPLVVAVALGVGWSRLYVGVHYPLDVLAGAALGALVATALLLLARTLRAGWRSPRRARPTVRPPG